MATYQLKATVYPENCHNKGCDWHSSDESVATVDEFGLVSTVASGECQIIATSHDGRHQHGANILIKMPEIDPSLIDDTLDFVPPSMVLALSD